MPNPGLMNRNAATRIVMGQVIRPARAYIVYQEDMEEYTVPGAMTALMQLHPAGNQTMLSSSLIYRGIPEHFANARSAMPQSPNKLSNMQRIRVGVH